MDKKLAKISHYRCGEHDSSIYVAIPADMTVNQLETLVEAAARKAIEAEAEVKGKAPTYPTRESLLKALPKTSTIAEVEATFEQQMQEYSVYNKKLNLARRSFYDWLSEVSEEKIVAVHDHDFGDFEVTCDWGHRHGTRLDYDEDGL